MTSRDLIPAVRQNRHLLPHARLVLPIAADCRLLVLNILDANYAQRRSLRVECEVYWRKLS